MAELQSLSGVLHVEQLSATRFRILHAAESNPGSALLALAAQHGWQAEQLVPLQMRMEDAFVQITQEQMK